MPILTRTAGAILEITLNRPHAMNCLDAEANDELHRVWTRFNTDAALHVAILTGAGENAFSTGADLKTLIPSYRGEHEWKFGGGLARGFTVEKPLIAAVNGHCLAGGLEMALACDIRICSPNARFGLPEVKRAIIPGSGGTQRLPRSIPLGLALEMIMTGDSIDATEALRVGLVNRIVPLPELMPSARELAARIASRGPLAVRAARDSARYGMAHGIDAGMVYEHERFREVVGSADAKEGPLAFAEKRPPVFLAR